MWQNCHDRELERDRFKVEAKTLDVRAEKVLRKINSMRVFLVAALLGCLIIPSYSSSQTYQRISASGIVRAGMRKTVIWADGSKETIEVTEKGRIFVNGSEVIAFGFHIPNYGDWGDMTEEAANNALDRLMTDNVRFMELGVPYWYSDSRTLIRALLDFWMPKLYNHKMFVLFCLGHEYPVDTERQMRIVNITIEEICTDENWANMIFAFGYNWEMDYFFPKPPQNGTSEELEAFLSNLYPRVNSALSSSIIGSIPVIGKLAGPWGEDYSRAVLKWSDIPCVDTYYRLVDTEIDYDDTALRVAKLHEIMDEVGKSGINVGYTEFGLWYKNNALFTKEKLQYGLSDAGYNDLSLMMIWQLWDRNMDGWNAFDANGDPLDWYLRIAPYFPA